MMETAEWGAASATSAHPAAHLVWVVIVLVFAVCNPKSVVLSSVWG